MQHAGPPGLEDLYGLGWDALAPPDGCLRCWRLAVCVSLLLTGISSLLLPHRMLLSGCREHISLSPADIEFWSWSFDEMAAYDLPAVIDFIRSATGAHKLGYVGHSQGTTMGFAAFSSQPELADKVASC